MTSSGSTDAKSGGNTLAHSAVTWLIFVSSFFVANRSSWKATATWRAFSRTVGSSCSGYSWSMAPASELTEACADKYGEKGGE